MNDITPPKSSEPVEAKQKEKLDTTQATETTTHVAAPVKKRASGLVPIIVGVLSLVVLLAGWYLWVNRNNPPAGVYADVNGQQETTKDFNELKSARIKFAQSGDSKTNTDPKAVEKTVADEVILRLALQDEAKKQGKLDCTQAKVDERLAGQYKDAGGREAFYGRLQSQYGWTEQVSAHQECLDYYKQSLQDSLVGGYQLFGVYVRWDIALGMDASAKAEIEQKAQDKLKNTFLPMFESGATESEIEAKADVNGNTSTADFDQRVISTSDPASRTLRIAKFNEAAYSEFQQYDEGDKETDYVYKLSEGGHTPVFKSKTGYYIIYRADKKFSGKYTSYDAMLASAQKTAKISNSYYKLPVVKAAKSKPSEGVKGVSFVSGLVSGLLRTVTPKAEAAVAPNSVRCFTGTHALPFTVEYRDKDTGAIISTSGVDSGVINIKSTGDVQTPCNDEPAAGSGYGVTISYPGGGIVNYAASGHPNPWDFSLSCYTSWKFNFGAPTGYDALSTSDYLDKNRFYLSLDYSGGSYGGYVASATDGAYQIPTAYYKDIANGVKGFTIKVYLTKTIVTGQIWSLSKVQSGSSYNPGFPPGSDGSVMSEDAKDKFFCTKNYYGQSVKCGADQASSLAQPSYLRTLMPTGVWYAGIYSGLVDPSWSIDHIEVHYFDACGGHGANTTVQFPGGQVDVRVCAGQTPTVTYFFKHVAAAAEYSPWLQTKDGNVMALGDITGQDTAPIDGKPTSAKEAEYVIMGYAVANFCSSHSYTFGGSGCTFDLGYYANIDSTYLGSENDPVILNVKKLIGLNTDGTYSPYSGTCDQNHPYIVRTEADMTARLQAIYDHQSNFGATDSCAVIGVVNTDSYDQVHNFVQGRATIYDVPPSGTLHINKNQLLSYQNDLYGSINKVPNIGLIVKGDVVIDNDVTEVDMSIYATGKIKTCSDYGTPACKNKLRVRGILAAAKGFEFGRNYHAGGEPAELIVGSGLIDAFPPPGFIDMTSKSATGVRYITTEGNPRF